MNSDKILYLAKKFAQIQMDQEGQLWDAFLERVPGQKVIGLLSKLINNEGEFNIIVSVGPGPRVNWNTQSVALRMAASAGGIEPDRKQRLQTIEQSANKLLSANYSPTIINIIKSWGPQEFEKVKNNGIAGERVIYQNISYES